MNSDIPKQARGRSLSTPIVGLWSRLLVHRSLVVNAASMLSSTAISAGLGFVFWWVAAQTFSKAQVGLASALIAAMALLGNIGMMGLGTLLLGKLARAQKRSALVLTGLTLVVAVSAILGIGFAVLAPIFSNEFALLRVGENMGATVLFVIGVVLTATSLVLDQAVIGLLRGSLQLWRNIVFATTKLVVLIALGLWAAQRNEISIYAAWALGNALSLLGMLLLAHRGGLRLRLNQVRLDWDLLRDLPREAMRHHMLNMALQSTGLAFPVLVALLLSAEATGSFAIASLLAGFVSTIPFTLAMALYAVGATSKEAFGPKLRLSLRLSLVLGVLANMFIWLLADMLMGIFGRGYGAESAWVLRLLSLGVFPIIVKDHYIAIRRVSNRISVTIMMAAIGGLLELGGIVIGAQMGGLYGLCIGWLCGFILEALFMGGEVWRTAWLD